MAPPMKRGVPPPHWACDACQCVKTYSSPSLLSSLEFEGTRQPVQDGQIDCAICVRAPLGRWWGEMNNHPPLGIQGLMFAKGSGTLSRTYCEVVRRSPATLGPE